MIDMTGLLSMIIRKYLINDKIKEIQTSLIAFNSWKAYAPDMYESKVNIYENAIRRLNKLKNG